MSDLSNLVFINGEYIVVTEEYPSNEFFKRINKDAEASGIKVSKVLTSYYVSWYLYINGVDDFDSVVSYEEAIAKLFEIKKEITTSPVELNVLTGEPIKEQDEIIRQEEDLPF